VLKPRIAAIGIIATTIALIATGCATTLAPASTTAATGITTVKVGATFPADEVLKYVESSGQAKKAGIEIQVTSFTDYTTPNTALQDGSIDANLYHLARWRSRINPERLSIQALAEDTPLASPPVWAPRRRRCLEYKPEVWIAVNTCPS